MSKDAKTAAPRAEIPENEEAETDQRVELPKDVEKSETELMRSLAWDLVEALKRDADLRREFARIIGRGLTDIDR